MKNPIKVLSLSFLAIATYALVFTAPEVRAQQTLCVPFSVFGQITDGINTPDGANVILTDNATGAQLQTVSTQGGFYSFETANLNPCLASGHSVTVNTSSGNLSGSQSFTYSGGALLEINIALTSSSQQDTASPTITVTGANPDSVQVGATYTDAGATATDNVDPTVNVITTGLPINTTAAGAFTVTYTATDVAGNIATATRTVNVTAAPGGGTPVTPPGGGAPVIPPGGGIPVTPATGVAPTIVSAQVVGIAKNAVAVTFTTNNPSLGFINRTNDKKFRKKIATFGDTNGLSTTHTIVVGALKKKTKYYFQMIANDGAGHQTVSGVFMVKTTKK